MASWVDETSPAIFGYVDQGRSSVIVLSCASQIRGSIELAGLYTKENEVGEIRTSLGTIDASSVEGSQGRYVLDVTEQVDRFVAENDLPDAVPWALEVGIATETNSYHGTTSLAAPLPQYPSVAVSDSDGQRTETIDVDLLGC
jgi:hypothetical protein